MNTTTITRRFQFCAGHRVHGHESKCAHMHGHNYVALVTCTADVLDSIGRVIDFAVIKEEVGEWIDQHWDHAFLAFHKDHEVLDALTQVGGQNIYSMDKNPTAENMATELLRWASQLLAPHCVRVVSVELWETENCKAEARP